MDTSIQENLDNINIEKPATPQIKRLLDETEQLLRSGDVYITGVGDLVYEYEDGDLWEMEGTYKFKVNNLIDEIDITTESLLNELYWDLEKILPSEVPDYDPRFQSIIGLLEIVTENQTNLGLSARQNAEDIIDSVADNQNDTLNDHLVEITDTLDSVGTSIENSSKAHMGFIGVCLDGLGDTLVTVGDTIKSGIEASSEVIEPALNAIGEIWELLFEKFLTLLKQLFLLDPVLIKDYMSTFFDVFQSFTKSLG